jgi:uncharacterized protein YbaA (DUF1428 family)
MREHKMGYVDGFVFVVPKRSMRTYLKMARMSEKIWRKYGALDYKECIGDDLSTPWGGVPFPRVVKLRKGEVVAFSYILYKSKTHRKRVNAKVMKDPYMTDPKWTEKPMPFDMKRMIYGGFRVIVGG